jgi:hypothetical protein
MTFLRIVIPLYLFCLSMIFSDNRFALFRIMLYFANLAFRLTATDAGTKAETLPPMPAI